MKVLDLRCADGHVFEGWFASEDDFVSQIARALVQCPLCGSPEVVKLLSAPRLNLLAKRSDPAPSGSEPAKGQEASTDLVAVPNTAPSPDPLTMAWLEIARAVVAQTDNVGARFAEEARKMHYREVAARPIRGTASLDETRALLEEGIEVLPLMLPEYLKDPLQ